MSKDDFQDIVCDVDFDIMDIKKDIEDTKALIRSRKPKIDTTGVIRDEKGRFVKGTTNPHYSVKIQNLNRLLEKMCGLNMEKALEKLVKIAMYDPDEMIPTRDEDGKMSMKRRKFHYYNAQSQLNALTLLIRYFYGNPKTEVQVENKVDIKIEKKVADLTKLINDNSERLKVVNGGKED